MKLLKNYKEKRRLKRMIRKTNHLHETTRKQYFVVPVVTRGVKSFTLMNNELHKKYNKTAKKMHKSTISYKQLLEIAVYKTPTGKL